MNIIKTKYFMKQLFDLKRKFPKIENDIDDFQSSIETEPFSDLWNWVFKFRLKNTSIPTWKSWGFRLIILFLDKSNCIPMMIYSKNQIENVSSFDILKSKEEILKELQERESK